MDYTEFLAASAKRRAQIMALLQTGSTEDEVADLFDVSYQRVREIYLEECAKQRIKPRQRKRGRKPKASA